MPPLSAEDHFRRLGLPRRHDVDRDALERGYLERAQRVHPDRFVGAPTAQQRLAMEHSAALNEAYRVLRDPVRRAEYLCRLGGVDLDSSDPKGGAPAMSQAFLIEMIERREAVQEAQVAGAAALEALRNRVEDELEDALDTALEALAAVDEDALPVRPGAETSPALHEAIGRAARALVERRYLQRLVEEIDGIDGGPAA